MMATINAISRMSRCGGVVLALALAFCTACDSKPLPADGSGDVHGAWAYMQLFVEQKLVSPKTADFPFGGFQHVKDLGSGLYEVDSYVDSQNSFGATVRTRFVGTIRKGENKWYLESLDFIE